MIFHQTMSNLKAFLILQKVKTLPRDLNSSKLRSKWLPFWSGLKMCSYDLVLGKAICPADVAIPPARLDTQYLFSTARRCPPTASFRWCFPDFRSSCVWIPRRCPVIMCIEYIQKWQIVCQRVYLHSRHPSHFWGCTMRCTSSGAWFQSTDLWVMGPTR